MQPPSSRMIDLPLIRGPFPTEKEFDARLRSLGFRPSTPEESRTAREATARLDAMIARQLAAK